MLYQPIKRNSPTSSVFYEATAYEASDSNIETTEVTPLFSPKKLDPNTKQVFIRVSESSANYCGYSCGVT